MQGDIMLPDVREFTFDDFLEYPLTSLDRWLQSAGQISLQPTSRDKSRSHGASVTLTPNVRKAVDTGQQAFRESMWL